MYVLPFPFTPVIWVDPSRVVQTGVCLNYSMNVMIHIIVLTEAVYCVFHQCFRGFKFYLGNLGKEDGFRMAFLFLETLYPTRKGGANTSTGAEAGLQR